LIVIDEGLRYYIVMHFLANFKDISKSDVDKAGGKGASLGEMTQAGISVPPGFIILAAAFDRFLEETDLNVEVEAQLNKVNYDDINSVDKASNVIRDLIHDAKMPDDLAQLIQRGFKILKSPYVAVRSSATAEDSSTASWAGELDTFLNTTKANLLDNVKKCWSSLFTARAIFYRNEKGMVKTKVSVAVAIQVMIQSEVSGITFTVHPVTEDTNQMIIEAGLGLGEAIVSGQITPDSYVINKAEKLIEDINVSEQSIMITKVGAETKETKLTSAAGGKQKLSGKQIMELADICLKVEKHYGFPCDIEWAYTDKKFYIVQSRPITTLK